MFQKMENILFTVDSKNANLGLTRAVLSKYKKEIVSRL